MKQVDRLIAERKVLKDSEATARSLFGSHWHGEETSWDAIEAYTQWVVDFRKSTTHWVYASMASQEVSSPCQCEPNSERAVASESFNTFRSAMRRSTCFISELCSTSDGWYVLAR